MNNSAINPPQCKASKHWWQIVKDDHINEKRNRRMEQKDKSTQDLDSKITSDTVLFFDMDGTLVDTNLANFHSYKKAIISVTKSNHDLTYNSDKRFNRSSLKSAVPNLTENEYDKIIQAKETYYNDFLHETKLNPEIADILFRFSKTNKTVLVTNCRKDRAIKTLKHFGLDDKFSYIFCREFDDNGNKINKFQNAILKLGVPPSLVIAFENEEIEIADAQKAGISIINPIHQ
jgi:beta-phosphoglucomutase-like phosphatase (HAD superfamily)